MKKKFLILSIVVCIIATIFIVYRLGFYYIILNEDNDYKYTLLSFSSRMDIYNAGIEEFENKSIVDNSPNVITKLEYNNKTEDKQIQTPMQAVKATKNFLDFAENEYKMKEPCFVTYNSNANVWIVQENIYKFHKNGVGGEFIAVFNAENGDIVYAIHFQ